MWLTISSGVLGFSFIFGNTLSQQLQTILLVFVVHPFDVGDALLLDGSFVTVEQTSLNKARCIPIRTSRPVVICGGGCVSPLGALSGMLPKGTPFTGHGSG